jgi:transcriptional regulator
LSPPKVPQAASSAIVGIEIPIDRLEGKLKASQDEAMPDRLGTIRGLSEQACETARAMAALVHDVIDSGVTDRP